MSCSSVKNKWGVNVNNPVAIWPFCQQFYGLGVEAVKEPFGPRLGTLVPLACVLAEETVYDLGDWSLWQFYGLSSDTTYYIGPGLQEAWPQ